MIMPFSFFKPFRPKNPLELVKAVSESLLALDTKTVAEVKALENALEEVEKNFSLMSQMLSGDGEVEPNAEHVTQLTDQIYKEDTLSLLIHKFPILGWEARKDLVHCWCIFLRQIVGYSYCCVEYLETHSELLDFLFVCYDSKDIALNCGNMLREYIKFPGLAKYIFDSISFELFFKYVELRNFDVASNAFAIFKDLLTKHETAPSEFLTAHYEEFFVHYKKFLTSENYVTRIQSLKLLSDFLLETQNSYIMKCYILEVRYLKVVMTLLKDSCKNIQISAFHNYKVFVVNHNKPFEIIVILAKNHARLLTLLCNLSVGKGAEDEQFEEKKDMIMKEIHKISCLPSLAC
ncbi:hypothetical protein GIB67_017900 [Kingdonia uniflora]|uniref:Calcium-binding protein 39-like n=1 Tax=Kingdonia uniflora TaxID=39325 RepID=A0A7J7NEX4_9MAGN|nr:hypothetical protein GIB67_017900 [Kingdonia uniflora]